MRHIAHLKKQFKPINTYDFVITFIKKRKKHHYQHFENWTIFHLNKLESPSLRYALCKIWFKLTQWFWRRILLNFINVFSLSHNYLPLENSDTLHLNKLESPSPKDDLCQVWLKLVKWFLRKWWKYTTKTTTTTT